MVYVVVGMHKSGTTLISEILHHSGIHMGDFDVSANYDSGNRYERDETKLFNRHILKCGDKFSLDTIKAVDIRSVDTNALKQMTTTISALNEKYENWGFKDPRTSLTLSVWKEILPDYRVIVVYRDPFEVWMRYVAGPSLLGPIRSIMNCWKSIGAWYEYNKNILHHINNLDNGEYTVINYEIIMCNDHEFYRLEKFIGLPLIDRRSKRLYRHRNFDKNHTFLYNFFGTMQLKFFSRDIERILEKYRAISC